MIIALDASNLACEQPTGVAVYGRQLVRHLAVLDRENRYVLCYRLSRWRDRRFFLRIDEPNFQIKIIQEPFHPFFMRRIDLFHGLDARMVGQGRAKRVVTIHDISQYSQRFSGPRHSRKMIRRYRRSIEGADRIIVTSRFTREEILRFFRIPEEKISVVPLGVDARMRPRSAEEIEPVLRRYGIRAPYLLHVGRIEARKNVRRTLEAFARVRGRLARPVEVVLAGGRGHGGEEVPQAIERLGIRESIRPIGFVSREDLPFLYAGAELLLFASLYEGFGLPVLEAMACGTPVLTSNVTSLPEVAGDAALQVDPRDVEAIAEGLVRLLEDPLLREGYVSRGLERAARFGWDRTARETLAVYREVAGEG